MKDRSGSLVCLVLLTCCVVLPVSEADAQGWVEYQNGKLSMAFEQAPMDLVVALIREETGMLVVLPPAARGKFLSVRVNALPPEAAVQRILRALGLSNFVLLYDRAGRAERLIVLEPGSDAPGMLGAALPSAEPGVPPILMSEEQRWLLEQFGRWTQLSQEARKEVRDRLLNMPPSPERERLVKQYKRQVWGVQDAED